MVVGENSTCSLPSSVKDSGINYANIINEIFRRFFLSQRRDVN